MLVPLYLDAAGALHAVFTERRADLRRHPGEISFPGGRRDDEDPHLCATALREAHEEIGLPPDAVELVGALQPTPTFVTNYAIYPFVGLIEPGFAWVIAEAEVGRVLELPLDALRAGPRSAAARAPRHAVPDRHLRGRRPRSSGARPRGSSPTCSTACRPPQGTSARARPRP